MKVGEISIGDNIGEISIEVNIGKTIRQSFPNKVKLTKTINVDLSLQQGENTRNDLALYKSVDIPVTLWTSLLHQIPSVSW